METMMEKVQWATWFLVCAVWLKSITGFHFPWEKCKCCDKPYKEHDKPKFD